MWGASFRQLTLRAGELSRLVYGCIESRESDKFPWRVESRDITDFTNDRGAKDMANASDRGDDGVGVSKQR